MKQDAMMGIVRAVLAALGGMLAMKGQTDAESWSQVSGAIVILITAVWSVAEKRKVTVPPASVILLAALPLALCGGCATTPNDIALAKVAGETAQAYYQQPVKAEYLVLEGDNVEWTIRGCKKVTLSGPIPAKSIYPRDQGTLQTVLDGAGELAKTAALGVVGYQGVKALKSISTQPATVVTTEKLVPVEGAAP